MVYFTFCPVLPPRLSQTTHVQPCLVMDSAEREPPGPGSLSKHGRTSLTSFFTDSLTPPEQKASLPPPHSSPSLAIKTPRLQHCRLKSSGLGRCFIFMLFSYNLQEVSLE